MLDKFDKNKNPFKVPDNYFEGLTEDIMNSLPTQETEVKRVPLWKKVLPWTGVAALIVAVAIAVNMWQVTPNLVAQKTDGVEEMTEQERIAYNEAEDYILFLEDEFAEAEYNDVLFEEE